MGTFNQTKFPQDFMNYPKGAVSKLLEFTISNPDTFKDIWKNVSPDISAHQFLSNLFKLTRSSEEILIYFYENEKEVLIKVIKETKTFLKPIHYEIIERVFKTEEIFLKEIAFWKNIWNEMYRIISKNVFFAKYDFEGILILCGFYYEKLRLTLGRDYNSDYDIIDVVNEILSDKIRWYRMERKSIESSENIDLFNEKAVKLLVDLIHNGDLELSTLFDTYKSLSDLKFCYDNYIVQDFEISFFNDLTANIKPEDEKKYLKYKKTGGKYSEWQKFYIARTMEVLEERFKEIENAPVGAKDKVFHKTVLCHLYQYIDAGFPELISIENKSQLNPEDCFTIINAIAAYSNDRWNNKIEEQIIYVNAENPYEIIYRIVTNHAINTNNVVLPVLIKDFKSFSRIVEENNRMEESTGEKSLTLFSNDLNNEKCWRVNLESKPFIRIGSNMYWISNILSNRNYSVMLQNILLENDNDDKGIIHQYSKNSEDELAFRFELNKFTVKLNHKYFYRKHGEIDVLAYKDNTLFICQVKSTSYRSTVREISEHFSNPKYGIKKAKVQLQKDIDYMRNNWAEMQELMGMPDDFGKIRIVPIALTTTLEEDAGELFIDGLKGYIVPLLDMRIILSNWKIYLLNFNEMAINEKYSNNIPPIVKEVMLGLRENEKISRMLEKIVADYVEQNKDKININLWSEGNKLCSSDDVLKALDNGSVWDFLDDKKSLVMKTLMVGNYTLNYFE